MRRVPVHHLILPVLLLMLPFIHACDEGAPVSLGDVLHPTVPVLDSLTLAIGPEGGSIILKDGSTLTLPPGALPGSVPVTFRKLVQDDYFSGPGLQIFDITCNPSPTTMRLTAVVSRNLAFTDFSVVNYDPIVTTDIDGVEPAFTYDSLAGSLSTLITTARVTGHGTAPLSINGIKRTRILVGEELLVEPTITKRTIKMPFYQQDAMTCYTASMKMMSRAYAPEGIYQFHDIQRWTGYPMTTGPNSYMYRYSFPSVLRRATGRTVQAGQYWWTRKAFNNLITQLDAGIPVMLGRAGHSITVIGYEKTTPGLRHESSYRFLINDPSGDYSPNVWKDWQFVFKADTYNFGSIVELWVPEKPASNRPLQTLGFPLTLATGLIAFRALNPDTQDEVPFVDLGYNADSPVGYGWKYRTKWVSSVGTDAVTLYVKLALRNSDPDNDAFVTITQKISQKGTSTYAYHNTSSTTLSKAGSVWYYEQRVPVAEFRQTTGDSTYTCTVELIGSGGKILDQVSFDFILAPAEAEMRIIKETGNVKPGNIVLVIPPYVSFGKTLHISGRWEDAATYPDAQYSILGGFVADETDFEKEFWVPAIFSDKFYTLSGFHHYFDGDITIPETDKTRKCFKLQVTTRAYNASDANAPYWLQTRIYKIPIK